MLHILLYLYSNKGNKVKVREKHWKHQKVKETGFCGARGESGVCNGVQIPRGNIDQNIQKIIIIMWVPIEVNGVLGYYIKDISEVCRIFQVVVNILLDRNKTYTHIWIGNTVIIKFHYI